VAKKPADDRPPPPVVRYAPLGEVRVYQITEDELEKLAGGPPGQIHLNIALALLPAALTLLVTLQTVEINDNRLFAGYLGAFFAFLLLGLQSLIQWRRASRAFKSQVQQIRDRMPPPAERLPDPEPPTRASS
jgi:hypothetical protein